MTWSTYRLHETLIRLFKGCLKAWETWLREQKLRGRLIDDEASVSLPIHSSEEGK